MTTCKNCKHEIRRTTRKYSGVPKGSYLHYSSKFSALKPFKTTRRCDCGCNKPEPKEVQEK